MLITYLIQRKKGGMKRGDATPKFIPPFTRRIAEMQKKNAKKFG